MPTEYAVSPLTAFGRDDTSWRGCAHQLGGRESLPIPHAWYMLATLRAMSAPSAPVLGLVLILSAAYLLGSVPFGYLLVRFVQKEDIRAKGSGNIGATNVARAGSKALGILTLFLDLAKGVVAVLMARHFAPGQLGAPSNLQVGAAIAAVLGHVFPVWLGFRGGKGVATALGVLLALAPGAALAGVAVFALVVGVTRLVSLASILAAAAMPVFAVLLTGTRSPAYLGGVLFVSLLVISKHHANISRLIHGTEPRFSSKRDTSVPAPDDAASKRKVRA